MPIAISPIRTLLICSLGLLLSACQDSSLDSPASTASDTKRETATTVCQEFNDGLVYNAEFAKVFSLEPANAIELDPGLMAVRIYWTELVYQPDSPKMQIQLYLEPEVNLQFPKDEGTGNRIEFLVRSGFRYFPHGAVPFERSNDEFNHRYVIEDDTGVMSAPLYRYRTNLTRSGIQAIELGTTFINNPVVYLYIGESPVDGSQESDMFNRLSQDKEYDPDEFLKLHIPSELSPIMKSPYRSCQGATASR
ncbi:hypothetical protein [Nitrincola sp. MINF-07-Sa-05]|uniref:hypothetical protein n=1 Tax=Nitrincola salilacus TaxID=3400273 RepID=UPI003917D557